MLCTVVITSNSWEDSSVMLPIDMETVCQTLVLLLWLILMMFHPMHMT